MLDHPEWVRTVVSSIAQQLNDASKSSDLAARGWRVTCHRLRGDRVLRAWNPNGKDHDFQSEALPPTWVVGQLEIGGHSTAK